MAIADLEAEVRELHGTQNARRDRRAGFIPGVIYGHKQEPEHIRVSAESLSNALRGHTHLCRLAYGGKSEQVIIKDVQFDYLGDTLVHIDFLRVDMNEKIEVPVAVEVEGHPRGLSEGGILEQAQNDVVVRCTPDKIPDVIVLRVDDLDLHDAIRNKDLPLEEGVESAGDPDAVVVMVVPRFKASTTEETEEDEEGETPTDTPTPE